MSASFRLDELGGNAHAVTSTANATLNDIADVEIVADLGGFHRLTLVGKCRIARDDHQFAELRHRGDQVLDDAVTEILLLRILAHIVEGEDGERLARAFGGTRRGRPDGAALCASRSAATTS